MEYDRLKNVGKLIAPAFYHICIAHFISSYWTSVLAPIIIVQTTLSANRKPNIKYDHFAISTNYWIENQDLRIFELA